MQIISTVQELVARLLDLPPDALVVIDDSKFGVCALSDVVFSKEANMVELV